MRSTEDNDPHAARRERLRNGAALELDLREQLEALPRYILMLQPSEGWTKEHGRTSDPVAHEVVKLADVLALLTEDVD